MKPPWLAYVNVSLTGRFAESFARPEKFCIIEVANLVPPERSSQPTLCTQIFRHINQTEGLAFHSPLINQSIIFAMKKILLLTAAVFVGLYAYAQAGFKVGEKVSDFDLTNPLIGETVSMADYEEAEGFILVFTCNHCPYAQMYEQRIMELAETFNAKGYPVIAINPNDPTSYPDDSPENMVARAKEMKYPFPYLFDETQEIAKAYGATRTPETRVIERTEDGLVLRYRGAIDDNYKEADAVEEAYTAQAVEALLNGNAVKTTSAKAVGCSIKWKKS